MKTCKFLRLIFFVALSAVSCFSLGEDLSAKDAATIKSKLKAARLDLEYTIVGPAPIKDFYEVQVKNGPLLYVTRGGDFFFDGTLYSIKPGQFVDARSLRLNPARKSAFADLSVEEMIVFKPEGATKAIINVFTDVDCGFCRKLHREMAQLNSLGIEVRYLAFPRAGIPSDSYTKIATAWCADDPQGSLTRSKNGNDDDANVCDKNPVASHYELGRRLGVTGTPAIVLMDGSLIPGYRKASDIAKILGIDS